MKRKNRALTCDEIRSIIRMHPALFAQLGGITANTINDVSTAVATLILANPAAVSSVVAAGMGVSVETAANMGVFRWIAAIDILAQTAAANIPLMPVLYEELEPLCFASGALQ